MDTRALASATVLGADGGSVRIADSWRDHPAVAVWLRHFGCVFCREHVAEIRAARPAIEAMHGGIVFVGNGTPRAAAWFQKRFAPDSTVLTDPDLVTYRAIGARSGLMSTLGPRAWGAGLRAFSSGARQTTTKGHPFQQGGVLVIAPGTKVLYRHVSGTAGDHAPLDRVLGALRSADAPAAA
ncbi:MAG TPA: peroxiredoxin-like family protein [Candidatus Acidoferrales bacterium]|nr:peroxiredoxin-like family protein [Candidatus Acidoferrales bacterium]